MIKILAVDDDHSILSLIEDVFRDEKSYILQTEKQSDKAMEILAKSHFDIVITDLIMPIHNGIEILKKAREYNSDVAVIIITGFASLKTTLEAIKFGVHDYLTKPFQIDELTLVIKNAAEKIKLKRETTFLKEQIRNLQTTVESLKIDNEICRQNIEKLNLEIENNRQFVDLVFKQKKGNDKYKFENYIDMEARAHKEIVG